MTLQRREADASRPDVYDTQTSSGGGVDIVGLVASIAQGIGGLFSNESRVDKLRKIEKKYGYYSPEYAAAAKKFPKAAAKREARFEKARLSGKKLGPLRAKRVAEMLRRMGPVTASTYPVTVAGPRVSTAGRLTIPQWARLGARRLLARVGWVGVGITAYDIAKTVFSKLPKAKLPKIPKGGRGKGPPRRGGPGISPPIIFPVPPMGGTQPPPPPSPRLIPRPQPRVLPGGAPAPTTTAPPAPAPAPAPAPTKLQKIIGAAAQLSSLFSKQKPLSRTKVDISAFQNAAQQPIGLTAFNPQGVGSGTGKCKCGPKKPRKKRPPRSVCYRGTYVETPTGLRKRRGKRVSCQPSRKKLP